MPFEINSADFKVSATNVELRRWPTRVKALFESKDQYQEILRAHIESLSTLQQLHYASAKYAILLIFQGMDGAGDHQFAGGEVQGGEVKGGGQPEAFAFGGGVGVGAGAVGALRGPAEAAGFEAGQFDVDGVVDRPGLEV